MTIGVQAMQRAARISARKKRLGVPLTQTVEDVSFSRFSEWALRWLRNWMSGADKTLSVVVSSVSCRPDGLSQRAPSVAFLFMQRRSVADATQSSLSANVELSDVGLWYRRQLVSGVAGSDLLLRVMQSSLCRHRADLALACVAYDEERQLDDAVRSTQLLRMLGLMQPLERQQLICTAILNRPNSHAARILPPREATVLLLNDGQEEKWRLAVQLVARGADSLWSGHFDFPISVGEALCPFLDSSPEAREAFSALLSCQRAAPHQRNPVLVSTLLQCKQWAIAAALCPERSVEVRGRFAIGDWRGALRVACSADNQLVTKRQQMVDAAFELLVRNGHTLQACRLLQLEAPLIRRAPHVTAMLVLQLAQRKQTQHDVQEFSVIIDDVLRLLEKRGEVGHPAVDVAAACALAACGAWERVLKMKSSERLGAVDLSLFVAAAAGGAPYEVLQAHVRRSWETAATRPPPAQTKEMLIRCAVESGAWQEALLLFDKEVPQTVLDHPSLLAAVPRDRWAAVFSPTTLMTAGQWQLAIALAISSQNIAPAVLREIVSRPELWRAALGVSTAHSSAVACAMRLVSSRSHFDVGRELLRHLSSKELPSVQTFYARAAAANAASARDATSLLLLLDPSCRESAVHAAWVAQEELNRPSRESLDVLLPNQAPRVALQMLAAHQTAAQPSPEVFAGVIAQCLGTRHPTTNNLALVRVATKQRGRRSRRSVLLSFLFDLQPASRARLRAEEESDVEDWSAPVAASTRQSCAATWQRAVQLLLQPISAVSLSPWKRLALSPPSVVERLLSRPSVVCCPERLGATVAAMVEHCRHGEALEVIRSAHDVRGLLPDFETLVEVVERSGTPLAGERCASAATARLVDAVQTIRHVCPDALCDNVLRAFAERRATSADGWQSALEVLSSLALAGARHLPQSVIDGIASIAPLPAVNVALKIVEAATDSCGCKPMPLSPDALRSVVRVVTAANMAATIDWISVPQSNTIGIALFSTRSSSVGGCRSSSSSILRVLCDDRLVSQWHVAIRVGMHAGGVLTQRDRIRIALLIAAGCSDSTLVCKALTELCATRCAPALQPLSAPLISLQPRRRPPPGGSGGIPLPVKCAVACEVARNGSWETALALVLSDWPCGAKKAPRLLQLTRMAVLHASGQFDDTLLMLLKAQRRGYGETGPLRDQRLVAHMLSDSRDKSSTADPLSWLL